MSLHPYLRHFAVLMLFLHFVLSCGHIAEGDAPSTTTAEEGAGQSDVVYQLDGFDTQFGLGPEEIPSASLANTFSLSSHTITNGGGFAFSDSYFLRGHLVFAPQTTRGAGWSLTGGF